MSVRAISSNPALVWRLSTTSTPSDVVALARTTPPPKQKNALAVSFDPTIGNGGGASEVPTIGEVNEIWGGHAQPTSPSTAAPPTHATRTNFRIPLPLRHVLRSTRSHHPAAT